MANSLILTKAQNAITAHDWTTAARLYKELLRGDESNVEYLKQLGSIYVRDGQDEKAIPYYEKIISLQADNTDAMVSLGAIFRRLKRYDDSVAILHKAQEISAENPNINYNLGFTYKERGDYDDAIDAFETVISRNPDDVLAHNHLGSIYSAKKEFDKAITAFKRGLQVDQNHPILNYNLAHVYEKIKNYPEAVRSYEIALKTRPGWLDAIRDFSELLIKCQETKHAQELVEQSIKLHPDDVDLLCILGRIYLNQFDYDNATKTFKRAETLKQNDIKILLGLSKALEKGMKIESAMEKILDAVDIAPENLDVCKQYAHVLLSAQRYEKALDMIKKIDAKSDGKDLQILDLYGQYFVCRGDEEAANTYFDKIKKIDHHYKDYMINASDRYIQTGNYEKAEKMANKFVDSRPGLPEGYNLLGTINSARGELNKAKEEYEKGISLKNPNIYAVKELEKIYNEMETNKEIYNDSEMPIAVDADKLSEEDGGNLSDDDGLRDNDEKTSDKVEALMAGAGEDDELPDIGSLEATPPIEQALTGEDGEFWEDFDDDPDAENKPVVEEEEDAPYDENEENSDLMSMMTPAAGEDGGEESLESGLSEDDGDFDFGDFEDAGTKEEAAETEAVAAEPVEQPVAEQVAESEPAAPVSPAFEPEPEPEPEPAPAAYTPPVSPAYEEEKNPVSMPEAQQLMNDLKQQKKELEQQQKDLELQQREFALQQKELANELKQENEKMIHESVEKAVDAAVDAAVEEKLAGYDLNPEPVVEEPVVEEPVVEEETVIETEPESEIEAEAEPEETVIEEAAAEDETADAPELEEPEFEESEVGESELEDDSFSEEESDEILAEEAALDGFDGEEKSDTISLEEDLMNCDQQMEETPFITVEEMETLCGGGVAESDSDAIAEALAEEPSESEIAAELAATPEAEKEDDDNFVTADDMLDKIGRILNDDDYAKSCSAELELFKKLRTLSSLMPEKDKNSYDCCRMRMVIEYIIQKMSGKPGLLITAESLIKSGVLGEEYNRQLEDSCEEELSNDLIRHVISDMKKLAQGLDDKDLCNALCTSADGILEQIALLDQKVSIF